MKRRLFHLVSAASLLLSAAAAVAWGLSGARPLEWHLLGMAHSADIARVHSGAGTAIRMIPSGQPGAVSHGYWDALWVRSQAGRLTLAAHALDYEGAVSVIDAAPPALTAVLAQPASAQATALARMPDSGPGAGLLGFAWAADTQTARARDGRGGHVSVQARMVTLPYWFLVLAGLPVPLLWLCVIRAKSAGGESYR